MTLLAYCGSKSEAELSVRNRWQATSPGLHAHVNCSEWLNMRPRSNVNPTAARRSIDAECGWQCALGPTVQPKRSQTADVLTKDFFRSGRISGPPLGRRTASSGEMSLPAMPVWYS